MIADQRNKKTGGLITISPPAKLVFPLFEDLRVLASGVDTLYLTIDIEWQNTLCFELLESLKEQAAETKKDVPVTLGRLKSTETWHGLVKPFGAEGYQWIVMGHEFTFKIGNWETPISKPSVIVQIRSEILWRMGPENAVKRACEILEGESAKIKTIKPSRVDVCVDLLMPESLWSPEIANFKAGRARNIDFYTDNLNLTGIKIGRGFISARLYDKVKEIKTKSKKYWMYDVWQLYEVPENHRVIRVEFQLLREAIKKLGIDTIGDLFNTIANLWAYCTQKWLQFKTNPGKQTNLRKTLGWWKLVQNGFSHLGPSEPLLRCDPSSENRKQAFDHVYGYLTSWAALRRIKLGHDAANPTIKGTLREYYHTAIETGKTDEQFRKDVDVKFARFNRSRIKISETVKERRSKNLPINITYPGGTR